MAEATVPYGRKTQRPSAVKEVHVLWITAGLGCDGDSVSITAATQPSIEDVLLGDLPGFPDQFMPFMNPPPGSYASSHVIKLYGPIIRWLLDFTNRKANKEPEWRHRGRELTTGYQAPTNSMTK